MHDTSERGAAMRDTVRALLLHVGIAGALAFALLLGERHLGWPVAIRQIGSGALIIVGSLLLSGGSSSVLYQKGALRGLNEKDIEEYKAHRAGNTSAGVRLFIVGAVLFVSLFML